MSIAGLGGGAAAYQQLQRLPNDLGQALEGIAGRQQADKQAAAKINEDRRIAKKADEDARTKSLETDYTKYEYNPTGFIDLDEMMLTSAKQTQDKVVNLRTEANKAQKSGDLETYERLKNEANRSEMAWVNWSKRSETAKKQMDRARKSILEGKVHDEEEGMWLDSLDREEYTVEEVNGDFKITAVLRDKNGQVVGTEPRMLSDINKGFHMPFEFEEATGKGGMLDNLMINFGYSKYDEVRDEYIVTEQKWDEGNEAMLQNFIDGVVGKDGQPADNREMYKWYKNATGKVKYGGKKGDADKWTDEDRAIVSDYIRKGVASQYEEEVAMKVRGMKASEKLADSAANRNLRKDLQEDAQEFKAGEAEKDRAAAKEKWQAQIAADAAADANKAKVKAMGKNPEKKMAAVKLYDYAKGLHDLYLEAKRNGEKFDETDVRNYYASLDTPFKTSWDINGFLGLGEMDYAMEGAKSTGDIAADNIFKNVKAMAKASGLEIEDTDIGDVMLNPDKFRVKSTGGFDPNNF